LIFEVAEMANLQSDFYHPGETQLQQTVGARERTEELSRILMKDHLIPQHREFFAGLEYLFLGVVDTSGRLRAVMVSGEHGFLSTPNEKILRLDAQSSDALAHLGDLLPGAMVGVIGIDLSNRRRNRMHGKIAAVQDSHVDIQVSQSYGNCPKYINIRDLTTHYVSSQTPVSASRPSLGATDHAAIRAADIFFIASYFDAGQNNPYEGADMSHRGGNPGLVHVDGDTLTVPDYFGNNLFNTFGNLSMTPATTLLFIDFETGETRQINGIAKIIADPSLVRQFPKALRLLQIKVTGVTVTTNATPLRWMLGETSPYNPDLSVENKEAIQ
jgi:predicted pyridoxine 5'-phosphate oxidase superfamily flavin-nucleotide-binding protein